MSASPPAPDRNTVPTPATDAVPASDTAPWKVRGTVSFPRRFIERATRGATAMAARIERTTVQELRLLQSRINSQWPSIPVEVHLSYRGGSFTSIRYALSDRWDFEVGIWISIHDAPDDVADDLLHVARTEHAHRAITRRFGSDPLLAASDEEIVEILRTPVHPCNAEGAAWRMVARREARLRHQESAHRRIQRWAAARARQDRCRVGSSAA
jgi:hypothetical protein